MCLVGLTLDIFVVSVIPPLYCITADTVNIHVEYLKCVINVPFDDSNVSNWREKYQLLR
jgi:hypothetical protein